MGLISALMAILPAVDLDLSIWPCNTNAHSLIRRNNINWTAWPENFEFSSAILACVVFWKNQIFNAFIVDLYDLICHVLHHCLQSHTSLFYTSLSSVPEGIWVAADSLASSGRSGILWAEHSNFQLTMSLKIQSIACSISLTGQS